MPQGERHDDSNEPFSDSSSATSTRSQRPSRLSITVPSNQNFLPQYSGQEGGGAGCHTTLSPAQGEEDEGRRYENDGWVEEDDEGVRAIELEGHSCEVDSENAALFELPPRTPISLPTISYGVDDTSNQHFDLRHDSRGTFSDERPRVSLSSFVDSEEGNSIGVRPGTSPLSEDVGGLEGGEEDSSEAARRRKEEHRRLAERTLENRRTSIETAALSNIEHSAPHDISNGQNRSPLDPSPAPPCSPIDSTTSDNSQPFISVANGPLAQLSTNQLLEPRQVPRGARSFLSSLLNRSPRSYGSSPRFPSQQQSPSPSPSASPNPDVTTPRPLQYFDRFSSSSETQLRPSSSLQPNQHARSSSLPPSLPPSPNASRVDQSMEVPGRMIPRPDTSPRLSRTIASFGRSVSMRNSPSSRIQKVASPQLSRSPQASSLHHSASAPSPPSLESIGVSVVTLTPSLSGSRVAPPLCGAILDDKYLLIGTSFGLDFMPLPLPGSLPLPQLGNKKRKSTRRPMSLVKRTKFKALAILNERSNILLAIAGRNDHIRVYPLDGIRALIERKMNEIELRDGYPFIQDAIVLRHPSSLLSEVVSKGKGKTTHTSSASRTAPSPSNPSLPVNQYRFPLDSSPPAYTPNSSHSDRRRPGSAYLETSSARPVSPTSRSFSRNNSIASLSNGSIVRAVSSVPRGSLSSTTTVTPSTSRPLRHSSSIDHIAHRRGSTATISRRRSRMDLGVTQFSTAQATSSRESQSGRGNFFETPSSLDSTSNTSRQSSSVNDGDQDRISSLSAPLATPTPASSTLESSLSQPIPRLVARSPFALSPAMSDRNSSLQSLIEAVTDGPPPTATAGLGISSDDVMALEGRSMDARSRKRWTVNGAEPSLSGPAVEGNPDSRSSRDGDVNTVSQPSATVSEDPSSSARTGQRDSLSGEFKSRTRQSSLQPDTYPTIPTSSQERQESGAKSSSTLEYVKLARTRGARLMRATETKKRTYLAVLCGGEGERIELFTGARSISLSLNRTFVLPETPRSIDLQLQGNDLVDIYLIYAQTIFALEPSTVRVREVGVSRRSHRSRRAADTYRDTTEPTSLVDALEPSETLPTTSATPPGLDHVETSRRVRSDRPSSPSLSPPPVAPSTTAHSPQAEASLPPSPSIESRSRSPPAPDCAPSATRKNTSSPYTTFTQLPFIPPVPSGVLSSSWTIPPLYTDVITKPEPGQSDLPLLSPISLLRGAAMRGGNGSPGLFLVTKGNSLSGIVTSDGKSVIKRPISWTLPTDSNSEETEDLPQDVQLLVVEGDKTVIVKFSPSDVRAVAVEDTSTSSSKVFSSPVLASPPNPSSSVQFLANHHQSQQLFYSEMIGQSWTIRCLASLPPR